MGGGKSEKVKNIKIPLLASILTAVVIIFLISYLIRVLFPLFIRISRCFVTDATSARYILSAIIQSEAAIFGIMLTSVIIILQVLAMRGGLGQKEIIRFLGSTTVILIIIAYTGAIGYDLILLKAINDKSTNVPIFLPIFLIISLIPVSFLAIISMAYKIQKKAHKKEIAKALLDGIRKFFEYEDISKESFVGAKLDGLKLKGANLRGANLDDADLREVDLSEADLCETKLNRTDLSGANLTWANLSGAALWKANLNGVNLSRATLSGVDLTGASLNGAYFGWAILEKAILCEANLMGGGFDGGRSKRGKSKWS